jgi:gluconolactonase
MPERTWQTITTGLQFPEGPCAEPDGSVVLVEIQRGTLSRVSPDGTTTVIADTKGGPNGAAIGPDGKYYVCNNGGFLWSELEGMTIPGGQPPDYIGGRIQRVDAATGTVEDLYTEFEGRGLRGPNDIVFDAHGGFYFTDLGKNRDFEIDKGAIYYGTAAGDPLKRLAFPLDHPNGCALSPDGSRLYAQESVTGRIWYWEIESPGVAKPEGMLFGPSGATLLHAMGGYELLDSMAVDSEGNVCSATLITGCVSVITPEGKLKEQIHVPRFDPLVTNICFGGPDLRTAYITSSGWGILYATEWHCPGLKLNYT